MNIFNLLATSQEAIQAGVEEIPSIDLNWIAKLISWLFDLFADNYAGVAIGAICFTLILKTIVLPLDVFSRVKTKKQALLMEKMRPQMEKLQKQYANDKNMYNQKYMELQKQNGYSPFGACLPMLISLVIFMVVFSSFSTYSNYANLTTYNNLVAAYNESVLDYVISGKDDSQENHFLVADDNYKDAYFVDYDRFEAYYEKENGSSPFDECTTEADKNEVVVKYIQLNAREAAKEAYDANKDVTSFFWIGNVWYPDSMMNKEVPSFSDFSSAVARAAVGSSIPDTYEESYNEVTYNLSTEKDTYNGYFVLIVLAIGMMFLQQFVTMRSQKATNELSSVDGSAASTNKWMMIIMPIIFGLFSFFYSAAFSMYMIVNTTYSLISTLIINKVVSVRFEKKGLDDPRTSNRKRLK